MTDPTFHDYDTEGFADELFYSNGSPRGGSEVLVSKIDHLPHDELHLRQQSIEKALLRMGITFTV